MAYVGTTNVLNTGAAGTALFTIKSALKLAGWTVISSATGTGGTTSLGTPASPGTDLITSSTGTALGSFNVANAWVRLREPGGGTREYILQNGNANNSANIIIKYSRGTGFGTGGTATVSQTTGGGDGIVFYGTGTDASPTPAVFVSAGTGYLNCIASDTATNGVYGWWFIWYLTSNIASCGLVCTEAVAANSTPAGDNDPSVRYSGSSSTVTSTSGAVWSWWEAYGLSGAVYRTAGYPAVYTGFSTPGSYFTIFPSSGFTALDPYTGRVPMFPLLIGKLGTMPKGFTTETLSFATTQNGVDTFNLSSAVPKIVGGLSGPSYFAIPWITNVVPLV